MIHIQGSSATFYSHTLGTISQFSSSVPLGGNNLGLSWVKPLGRGRVGTRSQGSIYQQRELGDQGGKTTLFCIKLNWAQKVMELVQVTEEFRNVFVIGLSMRTKRPTLTFKAPCTGSKWAIRRDQTWNLQPVVPLEFPAVLSKGLWMWTLPQSSVSHICPKMEL
jgi:hypothetical protein